MQVSQEGGQQVQSTGAHAIVGGPLGIWGPMNLGHTTLTSSNEQFNNPNWGQAFLGLWGQEELWPPRKLYDGEIIFHFFFPLSKLDPIVVWYQIVAQYH